MVRTGSFHCRGPGFNPIQELRPWKALCSQKKKTNKKEGGGGGDITKHSTEKCKLHNVYNYHKLTGIKRRRKIRGFITRRNSDQNVKMMELKMTIIKNVKENKNYDEGRNEDIF